MHLGKLIFLFPLLGGLFHDPVFFILLGDWVHSVGTSGCCGCDVSDGGSLANLYSNGYCNNAII